MNSFRVHILAADHTFYDGPCESLTIPAPDGQYGIWAGHANTICAIIPGTLRLRVPEGAEQIAAVSSGVVKIQKDLDIDLAGYDLLLVEDILDSGMTLSYIIEMLRTRNPKSIRICPFLDKPERRVADIKADYVGTAVPDAFVVGYGLDYDERYRNLPYLGVLKPSVYGG